MTFRSPGFVVLFKFVVMDFTLKNTSLTYQRAINLIFHDLLGLIIKMYIVDIIVKSNVMHNHLGFVWWIDGAKREMAI